MTTLEISTRRKLGFSVAAAVILLLSLEIAARVGAFVIYDFSPYFLTYGLTDAYIDQSDGHTATYRGYFKFPPSKTLRQYGMFKEPTTIQINNRGVRGSDFEIDKKPGTTRIVSMGASSTFGFYNRDSHTYPILLQSELEARFPQIKVEVINAGIPHMRMDNILAMLKGEIIQLKPDVVTFYEAFNNAGEVVDENLVQATSRWAHEHLAIYVALKRAMEAAGGPILHSKWSGYLPRADRDYVDRQVELHVPEFEKDLREFVRVVRDAGANPLFIRQPMTSRFDKNSARALMTGDFDYYDEIELIESRMSERGFVDAMEALMLVHAALLDTVDRVAKDLDVAVVDNVALVGADSSQLASYVHLSEEANRKLAASLADQIGAILDRGDR